MRTVIWLQASRVHWLGGGTISFSCWMYMGLMMLGRQKYIQHSATSAWAVCLWIWDGYWKAKKTHHQVLVKSQQNWLKQGVEQLLWESNLLVLFGIRRNCLRRGRSRSLYLPVRRAIKQVVVIKEAFYFCQLLRKFYPKSCSQGSLYMQRKLLGIINVDFDATGQLLIIYSAFVKYLREMGIGWSSASAVCRFQEGLWFS